MKCNANIMLQKTTARMENICDTRAYSMTNNASAFLHYADQQPQCLHTHTHKHTHTHIHTLTHTPHAHTHTHTHILTLKGQIKTLTEHTHDIHTVKSQNTHTAYILSKLRTHTWHTYCQISECKRNVHSHRHTHACTHRERRREGA